MGFTLFCQLGSLEPLKQIKKNVKVNAFLFLIFLDEINKRIFVLDIEKLSFPNVKEIGRFAFAGRSQLKSASFPDVVKINEGAFEGCINLTNITLGIEPPELDSNVFGIENNLLRKIKFTIPHNANMVAYQTFFNRLGINIDKVKICI